MFNSLYKRLGKVDLPAFSGTRVMMMPVVIGNTNSIPYMLEHWRGALDSLFDMFKQYTDSIGYITIDERKVKQGTTHRRAGLHVDGIYGSSTGSWGGGGGGWGGSSPPSPGAWGGGGGGSWGGGNPAPSPSGAWGGGGGGVWGSSGLITVASIAGCIVYPGVFDGYPGPEGECDNLRDQCKDGELLEAGVAYWMDGMCVHESIAMNCDTKRTFVRLSGPSKAPWFEGYTKNPLGIQPTGPILPRRQYMDLAV